MSTTPYMTIKEAAEFLRVAQSTLRHKMSQGIFTRGVHYFKRKGEIGVRFKRTALEEWVEEEEKRTDDRIKMARGYSLGGKGS